MSDVPPALDSAFDDDPDARAIHTATVEELKAKTKLWEALTRAAEMVMDDHDAAMRVSDEMTAKQKRR